MSGDTVSSKISGTLKAIALAGLVTVTSGLTTKIWDALPPLVATTLITVGLIFALTFPSWRIISNHLDKKISEARAAVRRVAEKDAAEQHVRDRLVNWLMAALVSAFMLGLLLATWVCSILSLPTPGDLLLWLFD